MTGPSADAVLHRRTPELGPVVDAHAHLGPYSLFFIPDNGAEGMIRVMDRCGVTRTVLSSHLAIQLDARAGNAMTAEAVGRYPDRLSGYLVVNPWQDPVAELEHWAGDPRFAGIKVHPSLHDYRITGLRYRPVWEYAAATGSPVLTHTTTHHHCDDPGLLEEVAREHPDVTFLAGHTGLTRDGFDDAIEVARRTPNVVLELCGSFMHGDEITRMVDAVGSRQVVFGSDMPFIDQRMSLGRVLFADLSEADRAAVLGGTMTRLLAGRHQR
ncbi:amidohydrolase family protein [Kribbella sp.]|uniref:amidohydrolase family protein n=1 Tax=Kribbella sp. TaxID=1871183 RepID=UPI002D68F784|nr:amidohydrolase family protein [Kribbella sp.]HZX07295.1 amidohydrolase family protein [Kribbella sp.]